MRQVVPGIWRVRFAASNANAYILVDAGTATVVDAGPPRGHTKLLRALAKARVERVASIVLTHAHADHAGGAADLAEATGAPILLHATEALSAEAGRPGAAPVATGGRGQGMWRILSSSVPDEFRPFPSQPLSEGDRIGELEAITTPGHSPGHTSLLAERRGVLFAGDAAWNIRGVRTPPISVDHDRARRSLEALAARPRFRVVCFGHGNPLRRSAVALLREAAAAEPGRPNPRR